MESKLSRRSAIHQFSYLVGGLVATPTLLSVMQSCQQSPQPLDWTPKFLSKEQSQMVSTLAELIIPRTETPGAIDAGVPAFIDQILLNCLSSEAQEKFTDGISNLQSTAQEQHGTDFLKLDSKRQSELLKQMAQDEDQSEEERPESFFRQLKQLTLLGYFNSEMGATQALEYLQIPGSYQGCVTLEPGQKAWAL